jgi:hypothetical protein
VLSNIEDWHLYNAGRFYALDFSTLHNAKIDEVICNILKYSTTAWQNAYEIGIASSGNLWITTGNNSLTDTDLLTNWLNSKNAIIYYIYKTPNITEITDDNLINQLEELAKARSFDEQTNISQLSEQLPFDLTVDIKTL